MAETPVLRDLSSLQMPSLAPSEVAAAATSACASLQPFILKLNLLGIYIGTLVEPSLSNAGVSGQLVSTTVAKRLHDAVDQVDASPVGAESGIA